MKTNVFINSKWEDYIKSIPDESIDLVFTDPPYNVSNKSKITRDYRKNTGIPGKKRSGDISFDFGKWDYGFNPVPFLKEVRRILREDGSIIAWTSGQLIGDYRNYFKLPLPNQDLAKIEKEKIKTNFFFKAHLFWVKANPPCHLRNVNYRSTVEMMLWASKNPIKKNCENFHFLKQAQMKNVFFTPICGGKERISCLCPENCGGDSQCKTCKGKKISHPTQKPLFVCREIIKRHSRKDGIVLDFFGGVGSIAIAAYQLRRRYISIEVDWRWHELAERRLRQYRAIIEEETDEFEQIKMF